MKDPGLPKLNKTAIKRDTRLIYLDDKIQEYSHLEKRFPNMQIIISVDLLTLRRG